MRTSLQAARATPAGRTATMSETVEAKEVERPEARERVQDALAEVSALLRKHRLVEGLVNEQLEHTPSGGSAGRGEIVESLVTKQNRDQLTRKLDRLHPADIAYILEALPLDERLYIWDLVRASRDGEILLEVSDAVRESLISSMDTEELVAATETLDAEEIADLAPDLPQEVMDDVFSGLPLEEREQLRAAMSFDDDMVGALMDFEDLQVRPDVTLEVVLRYLRRFDELPSQTDQLFVVDRDEKLLGILPINRLIVSEPDTLVATVMQPPVVKLMQHEKAGNAASAFERYDLVSAPVVDTNDKLVGRVTVDEILDFVRETGEEEMLAQAGLREEEDVFASVWKSFQNRWSWLAINLVTAFIASRVIGAFEGSIAKLVALAALMPIVAGIGGNSGNQTITMIVRAVALGQVTREHARKLFRKEIIVAAINGVVWGGVMGLVAMLLYKDVMLGLVMVLAMTLNLMLAALMGVLIPMTLLKFGRDPAVGSSVLITAVTDSGGFFIFLGLATLILIR
jgi:magnesium transporter